MSDQIQALPKSRDAFSVPVIWVAVVLSLLIHVMALWQWRPALNLRTPGLAEGTQRLTAQLLPPGTGRAMPVPDSAPWQKTAPPPSPPQRVPPAAAAAALPPPVLALNKPAPQTSAPPTARAPAESDMSAMIEARRRARSESSQPPAPSGPPEPVQTEDEKARRARIQAENMGINRPQSFGYDPRKGGGVFQIERLGIDSADFLFFGWNKDIKRNTMQQIEVRRGTNANIRIAVVRKMIAIIREYESGDFYWESSKLRRGVMLSARMADNAGLEEFMMREFFSDTRLQ